MRTGLDPTAVLSWQEAFDAGPAVCGWKGYNLARLKRYGFPVPDGGVLPAKAYRVTVGDAARLDRLRSGLQIELPPEIDGVLHAFLSGRGLEDAPLAIRSSATAEDSATGSFAGIYRSVLHVRGLDAVKQAIALCYGSLWTEQARAYCAHLGIAELDVDCAIVLCRMVVRPGADEPACAGVAFSADPITGRRDLIVIESAPGLGENVVQGKVSPTRYVFRRSILDLVAEKLPTAGPLTEQQALELVRAADRIEWALGEGQAPQDIEWAHDGEKLWLLQARPITHVPRAGGGQLCRQPQYWSTANIKDAVPGVVSQLSWSVVKVAVEQVAFAAPRSAGYPLPEGAELVRRFGGRAYFDTTQLQWVMFDSLGVAPADFAHQLGGTFPLIDVDVRRAFRGRAGRMRLRCLMKVLRNLRKIEDRATPIFQAYINAEREASNSSLKEARREALAEQFVAHSQRQLKIDQLVGLANGATARWLPYLEKILRRRYGNEASALCAALSAGSGDVTSAEHGYAVDVLAEAARHDDHAMSWLNAESKRADWKSLPRESPFRVALERFLAQFGHRATYEAELMNPRWADDPAPILEEVRRRLVETVPARDVRAAAMAVRLNAESRIRREAPLLWPIIRRLAEGLRKAWAVRELGKAALCAGALTFRRLALEIGTRLAAEGHLETPEDVFHLSFADLDAWLYGYWDGRGAGCLACDSRARREAWLREPAPPDTIPGEGGRVDAIESVTPAHGDTWTGVAVSPGYARAVARIVLHPDQGDRLKPGEILVTPSTDPGWTPLFLRASAVLMEVGGYLSHGAIVAREYGLPAVANIPGLLSVVRDGEILEVNGEAGTVSRIARG